MNKINKYSPEEIINSIDGLERAEPGFFLLTRIQQQIKNQQVDILPAGLRKLLIPLSASLALFMVLNIASYFHLQETIKTATPVSQPATKQSPAEAFANDYNLESGIY